MWAGGQGHLCSLAPQADDGMGHSSMQFYLSPQSHFPILPPTLQPVLVRLSCLTQSPILVQLELGFYRIFLNTKTDFYRLLVQLVILLQSFITAG